MSDKKNAPQKPRFVPTVEDVDLPGKPDQPGTLGTPGTPDPSGKPGQTGTPGPSRSRVNPVVEDVTDATDAPDAEIFVPSRAKGGNPAQSGASSGKTTVNPVQTGVDPAQTGAKSAKTEANPAQTGENPPKSGENPTPSAISALQALESQSEGAKKADSAAAPRRSLFKRGRKAAESAGLGESGESAEPGGSGDSAGAASEGEGASERAITQSGMIRRDDEIDRSIFAPGAGVDPGAIGFSPETDVTPLAALSEDDRNPLSFGDLDAGSLPEEEEPVRKVKVRKKSERGASLRTLAFGVCYLAAVILLGLLLGSKIVSIGNDIFAFTFETDMQGNPASYTVVIEDAGMSPAEVGRLLKDAGVIKYDWAFKLYAQLKKKENFKVTPGVYTLSADANYDSIMSQLNPVPPRQEITITFTEGMNTDEIIELFLENGVGTREGFEKAINSYPYSYWFMDYLRGDLPEGRFYRLDGYLYPDTYRFYSDTGEVAAIDKLLANFDKKFGEEYKEACDDLGLTPDEVVRIASMIEAEVKHAVDVIPVASIFHNRMKSATFNGLLQSDATVQYYFYHTEGARHEEITPADLQIDTPYNTYLHEGLPPGAVCNPSLTSLRAALYPDPDCPYYYFVSRPNGYMYYARTLSEHNANIEKVRQESQDPSGGVGEHE